MKISFSRFGTTNLETEFIFDEKKDIGSGNFNNLWKIPVRCLGKLVKTRLENQRGEKEPYISDWDRYREVEWLDNYLRIEESLELFRILDGSRFSRNKLILYRDTTEKNRLKIEAYDFSKKGFKIKMVSPNHLSVDEMLDCNKLYTSLLNVENTNSYSER